MDALLSRLPPLLRKLPPVALAVLAGGLLPACKKPAADAPAAAPPLVLVTEATQRKVNVVGSWTGTLDGSANVEVRTRVTGYLTEVAYVDGAAVKKGDLLFKIDPRPFVAALSQAKASHLEAVARRTRAEQDVARYEKLVKTQAISVEELEHAVQAKESAAANVDAALANVEQAELNLSFTSITSEVDGIAGFSNPGVGDLVGPSDPKPLTTVSTVDPIKVTFQISEQGYLLAKRHQEEHKLAPTPVPEASLTLELADRSTHPHPGKWISISREVDSQTGTFSTTAHFPNPGNLLRPGQFARVGAVLATNDAVVIPQRAVSEVQGTFQVAVVTDGKAEIRPVKVGQRDGSDWVIESGLKAGETVIVEGTQKVRSGVPVQAQPWTPPAGRQPTKPEGK